MQPRLLRSPARLAGSSLLRLQTDERLVALAREGHERAFEAIVERYSVVLERYATRLVGPSRGEDAVQQAFVNAHSYLIGHPDKAIELRPWLYRIVHNAALNTLRASRDEQPLDELTDRAPLGDDVIERRERLREALDAVAALPPTQRDAILLRELEGRSHEEIALALGVSAGAARQQIFRARAALRAAATAITPQPLLIRTLEMATSSATSGTADLAAGAGAGLTAVLAKAGAGVLVTGAVVGSAVGTGVVPTPRVHDSHSSQREAARVVRAAPSPSEARASAVVAGAAAQRSEGAGHERSAGDAQGSRGEDRRGSNHSSSKTTATHRRPAVSGHTRPNRSGTSHQETHSGAGSHDATTEHSGRHGGKHGGSGSGSGKSGGGSGEAAEAPEVEAPETETDSGGGGSKGGSGGGDTGGKGGGEVTTTPTAPSATPTTPAPVTTTPQAPVTAPSGGS